MQDSGSRWRDMLASGCRTGEEYTWAWEKLRTEANEACLYLNKDMQCLVMEILQDGRKDALLDILADAS